MPDLPLSSSIAAAQQLLAGLQDQISSLSPDCQDAICTELDRLSETLKRYLADSAQPDQPGEPPTGAGGRPIPVSQGGPQMGMVLRRARAGMFVRDLVQKTVSWSPELYELLGIDPAESSRLERFMGMIHPEDLARVEQDTQAAIAQGGTYYQEFRVFRPDGEERWMSSIGYVEKDADGRPLTLTGIDQDITERKKAELALELAHAEAINERNRLLAVMEALPIGVAIHDLDGRVVQANHGYDEIWGSPRQAAYAKDNNSPYKAWWAENGRPVQVEEWASTQAVQSGKTVNNQFLEIERLDGSHCFVLNSAAPILNAAGRITGCVVAMRDLTQFTQVEKALQISQRSLRESEQRFRVVLSSLPVTVFMLDRDLRYTWIYNPPYGMTPEQYLGFRDDEINPRTGAEQMDALRAVLATGQGLQRETISDLSEQPKYLLLSYEPYHDWDGAITGIIGASLDITERRRLEEAHREAVHQVELQRQIVENREQERQDIAREIHDGPIQTLVGIMFDLQLTRDDTDQAAVREELDQVNMKLKSAVKELRDVVNNLRPPALLRFGLGKSLKVYAEDYRSKHPELALDLSFDLPDDHIYFSEEMTLSLYRLCQEGLNNIARHAEATKARIRFAQEGENVFLEIWDNGKGFPVPKDLVRKTRDGHFGLTGMKERVQALGGEFRILSTPGAGTTIEVLVPLEQTSLAI